MRNILHCRRGAAAFATVIALVPLIGAVALGTEAGSWYVTKQHAQTAADAAAYSGALRVACSISGGIGCDTAQDYVYRGKQFAAQNAFCTSGDSTAYPGRRCASLASGTSQTVQIASLTTWNGVSGNYVQATVSQQQPAYLAKLLGSSTVTIGATAIAKVDGLPKPPCALALTGSISFQGSPNIIAPNCGMASNSTANNALNFTGGGMTMNLGSLSAAGGCTGAATFCNPAYTHMSPIKNPFSALDAVTIPTLANCSGSGLTAYTAATPCKNNNVNLTGHTTITLCGSGVYFISGTLTLKGGSLLQTGTLTTTPPCPANNLGSALFILLPSASLDTKGGGTITITGNASVATSQLPTVLQPYANLFANMALYYKSSTDVQIGGNSNITFNGNMYAPTAAVTFQGNPTVNGCGELIAKSIAFNGNATFDSTGCSSATKPSTQQYVELVQ